MAVFVEADFGRDGFGPSGRDDIVDAHQSFEQALANVKSVADTMLSKAMMLCQPGAEIEIELGVSLSTTWAV